MARVGLKSAMYNKIVGNKYADLKGADGNNAGEVPCLSGIIDEKFSPEYNSAELYANDMLYESDYSFKKGALNITVADDGNELYTEMLGHKTSNADGLEGEISFNIDDKAPEIGYGHIVPKIILGERRFKVEFFPRVKCTKITCDNKTKGESVEFGTTAIEAVVLPLVYNVGKCVAGEWQKHKTFATYAEAVSYLDGLLTPEA